MICSVLDILPSMGNPDILYVFPVFYKHLAVETAQFGLLEQKIASIKGIVFN